jgi:hypothetical protein
MQPRRVPMRLDHAVTGNPQTEVRGQSNSPQRTEVALENELENRMRNLERLAESIEAALGRESFSGKPHALDLATDLHMKIKASWRMFRLARLLSEPARGSMVSKVRESVDDLEDVVASQFGVEMT